MNNIMKAAKFDFALLKPFLKSVCFAMMVPIIFPVVNRSLFSGISFSMCVIAMTSSYTFSVAEKNSMERLYGFLPVTKVELVIGKYILVELFGLGTLIFAIASHTFVLQIMGVSVTSKDMVNAALYGMLMFALYTAFQIPGYYKYGSIKGKVFMFIPVVGFMLTSLIIRGMEKSTLSWFYQILNNPFILSAAVVVLVTAITAISILISVNIAKAKEV